MSVFQCMGCWFLAALMRIRDWSWSQHLNLGSCMNGVLTRENNGAAPSTANVMMSLR